MSSVDRKNGRTGQRYRQHNYSSSQCIRDRTVDSTPASPQTSLLGVLQSIGPTMVLAATAYLLTVALGLLLYFISLRIANRIRKNSISLEDHIGQLMPKPPGPTPLPLIGSLHLLGQYEVPFEAFTELSKIYGEIYSITLGSTPCVVVNTYNLIKEVLITKGAHFGGRPDFIRFHKLFGGDRNNCKFPLFYTNTSIQQYTKTTENMSKNLFNTT